MSQVTVAQAAFLTGKSRQTINKFTKSGKLSFTLNAEDAKVIEISELQRLLPLVRKIEELDQMEAGSEPEEGAEHLPDLREQLAVLKAQLQGAYGERDMLKAERERERRQLEEQIESLRSSLEKAQDQHGKAMLMLTDQSQTGKERERLQEQKVAELTTTVETLKHQNKRVFRAFRELRERTGEPAPAPVKAPQGFWQKLFA